MNLQEMMQTFSDGRHEWSLVEAVGDSVILCGFFTGTHRDPVGHA
jgi:hypothetical protein